MLWHQKADGCLLTPRVSPALCFSSYELIEEGLGWVAPHLAAQSRSWKGEEGQVHQFQGRMSMYWYRTMKSQYMFPVPRNDWSDREYPSLLTVLKILFLRQMFLYCSLDSFLHHLGDISCT